MLISARLWFAFILLSLSYWKQPLPTSPRWMLCCDLLSFYYLCRTGNNRNRGYTAISTVVICFHFTIFVVLETTWNPNTYGHRTLWFAFILLSLSYWKQLPTYKNVNDKRCDLLSFYYLCRTGNNSDDTTHVWRALWFAFILLSLSYWKQRLLWLLRAIAGCDLLSFYYLCRTGNNMPMHIPCRHNVVICFHFTIFVVLETTWFIWLIHESELWFAFILLSLSYWKQLNLYYSLYVSAL